MVLALAPGTSLGQFELGTLLWNVLTILRASQSVFPNVQVCWDAQVECISRSEISTGTTRDQFVCHVKESATGYILLSISSPAIRLLFDGRTQRLILIEAYHPPPLSSNSRTRVPPLGELISYRNQLISLAVGPNDPGISLRVIHRLFGPTYPPSPHVAHPDETVTSYPGVAFSFQNQLLKRVILSIQPNEENDADADRTALSEAYYKPKTSSCLDCMDGDIAGAEIKLGDRGTSEQTVVCFSFQVASPAKPIPDINVVIGQSTSEDIMCDFGAPLRTFWKEDDRMKIHAHLRSPEGTNGPVDEPNPYFMSYFNLGVDFLIDPISNVVTKMVLHSNIPGEVLFARYSRCPWSICRRNGPNTASSLEKCTPIIRCLKGGEPTPTGLPEPLLLDTEPHDNPSHAEHNKWQQQPSSSPSESKVPPIEPAMVLDRTADLMDDGLTLQKPTRLIGFDGAVLEVTENDDVETLWLF